MSLSYPIILDLEPSFSSTFKTFRKRLKKAVRLGKEDPRSNLCVLDSLSIRGRLVYCSSQVAQNGGLRGISDLLIDLLASQLLYYCPGPGGSSALLPSPLNSFVKMGTTLLGGSVWLSRSLVAAWWTLKDSGQLTSEAQNTLAKVAMYSCRMCKKLLENSSSNSRVSLTWTVLTLAGIVMQLSSNDQSEQLKTEIRRSLRGINTQLYVDFSNIVLCYENRKIQKKIKSIVAGRKTIPIKMILMNVSVDQLIKVCQELETLESADIESKEPETSQSYQNCLQDSLKILLETTIFSTLLRKNAENKKSFDKQLKGKEKRKIKQASKARKKCKKQTFRSQTYSKSYNDEVGSSNMGSSIPQYKNHLHYVGGSLSESELEIVEVVAQCLKQYDINKKNKIVSSVPLPLTPPTSPGVDQIDSDTVEATKIDMKTKIKTKLERKTTNKFRKYKEYSKSKEAVDEMNQFEFDPVTRSRYDGSLSFCLTNDNSFTTIKSAKNKKTNLNKSLSVDHFVTCCSHPVTSSLSVDMNKTYPLYEKNAHIGTSGNSDNVNNLLPDNNCTIINPGKVKSTTNEKKKQIKYKLNDSELKVVKHLNTASDSGDSYKKGVTIKKKKKDLRFNSYSKILERSNHSNSYVSETSSGELEISDMEYQSSYYSEVNLSPCERLDDSKDILHNEENKHNESSDVELSEINWKFSYGSSPKDSQSKNKGKRKLSHNIKHDANNILDNENQKNQYLYRNKDQIPSNSENINSKRLEMQNFTKNTILYGREKALNSQYCVKDDSLQSYKHRNKETKSVCEERDIDFFDEDNLQNAQNLSDESCISSFVSNSTSQPNDLSLGNFGNSILINSDDARNVSVVEQQSRNITKEDQNEKSFQDWVLPLNKQASVKGIDVSKEVHCKNSNFLTPICSASSYFLNQECSSVNTQSPKAIQSNIHIHSSGDWICDRMLVSGRRVCMILDFDDTSNENIFEVRLLVEMEFGVDEVTFPISLLNYEKISSSFENRTIEKRDLSTYNISIEDNLLAPSTPSIIPPTPKTPKSSYSFNFDSKQCAISSKEFCVNKNSSINHHSILNECNDNYLIKINENLNNCVSDVAIPSSSVMGPDTQSIFQKPNVCSTIELDNTINENNTYDLLQNQDYFVPPSNSDVTGPLTREIFYQQSNKYNSDKESIDGEDMNKMAYSFNAVPDENLSESSCIEKLENINPIPIARPAKRKLNFNKSMEKNKISSFVNNSSNSEFSQNALPSLSDYFSSSNRNPSNTSGFDVEELGNNKSNRSLKMSYIKRTPSWMSDSQESFSSSGGSEKQTVSAYFQRKNQSIPRLLRSVTRKGLIRHYNKMRFRTMKKSMHIRNKKK